MSGLRASRAEAIIAGVLRQAVRDADAVAIMVLDASSVEGSWLLELCGRHDVVAEAAPEAPPALAELLGGDGPAEEAALLAVARAEAGRRRMVVAHPANRTALLLAEPPPADILPFGDVPAAFVDGHRDGWSAPASVKAMAEAAGGIAALDGCLHRWLDRREDFAVAAEGLPEAVARDLRCAIRRTRFRRLRAGLVPKLGYRTIGHDLQF